MFLENLMLSKSLRANRLVPLERGRTWSLMFAALAAFLVVSICSPVKSGAQEEEQDRGWELFAQNCAPCHGLAGKGPGPVGLMLKTPPPDLTQLAKNNQGEFPFMKVMQVIDGRKMLSRAHGTSEMPVWGAIFKAQSWNSEPIAAGKVLILTEYVKSIQKQ